VRIGTLQIGAQFILLTIATRFSTAADIALVMILEATESRSRLALLLERFNGILRKAV
jgi:hypothetical protein